MGTGYADSATPVFSALYNQVAAWQGHTPYGWGRYFLTKSDNGSGGAFYDPSTENGFFHDHQLRLLPIAYQGIYTINESDGITDGKSNLNAVLDALGGNATTPFFAANGTHYCAFMLDCESVAKGQQVPPPEMFTDYLYGWLKAMKAGISDNAGNQLVGWTGVYSSQDACNTWQSIIDCVNTYGVRPDFVVVASWLSGQRALPTWDSNYTSTDKGTCQLSIGQYTVMWQYAGDAQVNNNGTTYLVDLDEGNPHLDFHTALGQYAPIPN